MTIREILLEGKRSKSKIEKATKEYFDKDDDNVHLIIRKVPLTVSYDICLQKRSTFWIAGPIPRDPLGTPRTPPRTPKES